MSKNLNLDIMNQGAKYLIGQHDCSSFSKSHQDNPVCYIKNSNWIERKNLLVFSIEADRFLYNMVRCIVGTLINLGLDRINLNQFIEIINSHDRTKAGVSVPSEGLYLINIKYPKSYKLEIS